MTAPYVRTRDELVDQLVEGRRLGWWLYLGTVAPGEVAVEVAVTGGPAVRRQHDVAGMSGYLDGYAAGRALAAELAQLPIGQRAPDEVRHLLNCPSVLDQRRIRVAHAMEVRGWTYADVAAHLHAQRSTVRGLLEYGRSPNRVTSSSRRLDEIELIFARELRRGYGRAPAPIPNVPRVQPLAEVGRREPAELRRTRALALAVEGGLLSTWSPLDVTDLRAARVAQVVDVAERTYAVRTRGLIPWVQGLTDGAVAASIGWPPAARDQLSVLARALT